MLHDALSRVVRDIEFWRALAPDLTVSGELAIEYAEIAPETLRRIRRSLENDGYFEVPELISGSAFERCRDAVRLLELRGWPAVFVYVFDEPWRLFTALHNLLISILGEQYRAVAGFWAWNIPPLDSAAGWRPHRDRGEVTISNGRTELLTLWLALTDATQQNGCIHVVPASCDSGYATSDLNPDLPNVALGRPVPAKAGTVLGWTHHLLHWGGRSSSAADGPRVSLSMEFQRGDVPLRDALISYGIPPFDLRLALIGAQILRHEHMEPTADTLHELAVSLCAAAEEVGAAFGSRAAPSKPYP